MTTETKGVQRPLTSRQKAKQKTRTLILGAAQEMFHHAGYDAVTIRDLAAKIERSTGSIFSCYPDKAALFEAAMGEPAPDVAAFLLKVFEAPSVATTDTERVEALYELSQAAWHLRRAIIGHHS